MTNTSATRDVKSIDLAWPLESLIPSTDSGLMQNNCEEMPLETPFNGRDLVMQTSLVQRSMVYLTWRKSETSLSLCSSFLPNFIGPRVCILKNANLKIAAVIFCQRDPQ